MSGLFGGSKSHSAKPEYTQLRVNTSTAALPVPLIWGKTAGGVNIMWYGNFQAHAHKQKAGKGGGKSVTTSYTYSASLELGICAGPINGFGQVWKHKDTYTGITNPNLNFTGFNGTASQAPWTWLQSYNPSQAIAYPYTAYLAGANFDLGTSDSLPNLRVEVMGALYNTGINGQGDADIPLVAKDYLTGLHGVGLPPACIDNGSWFSGPNATTTGDSAWQTYCRALGIDFSPVLDSVEKANDVLARWLQITNTAAVWSGSVLKAIPYGDAPVSGNGYVFTPNVTPIYDLSDSDFVRPDNADPIQLIRSDPADAYNCYRLEYSDRTVRYAANVVETRDQASVESFGLRVASQVTAHELTSTTVTQIVANLICQRSVNIRNTYTFKLSWEYFLLEPMDLVTLTDPGMGMIRVAVRITSIEEDDQGILTIVAEEFPSGTATATAYPSQTNNNGLTINAAIIPASVNAPVIFEPPATLTGGAAQVWIAASGGTLGVADPNWGGCNVWLSPDGVNYSMVGTITGPARMGVLTAALASFTGANPDNSHTLAVNLNESAGTLSSGSSADAAAYRTLCYCDGELLSYETATLTGTGLYNLTTLYRGIYGTTASAHASGSQFARLDGAVFQYDLPQAYVGIPITVKLQSFNIWGGGVQDLSTCTAYTYTPVGTGFPLLSSSGTYGGVTYNASGQVVAVASNAGVNPYDIAGFLPGIPTAGQTLFRIEMVRAVTLPASLTGSRAVCQTAPTGAITLPIKQNGTSIGSINFAASATTGTFTFASQVILNPGDVLELDAPNPADATFAGPSYTITGTR
ncbi:MAG: phage tail protein [Pseudomonadota bacterium]|nr:phage tail protein [Pseudomonadota bacterium]